MNAGKKKEYDMKPMSELLYCSYIDYFGTQKEDVTERLVVAGNVHFIKFTSFIIVLNQFTFAVNWILNYISLIFIWVCVVMTFLFVVDYIWFNWRRFRNKMFEAIFPPAFSSLSTICFYSFYLLYPLNISSLPLRSIPFLSNLLRMFLCFSVSLYIH